MGLNLLMLISMNYSVSIGIIPKIPSCFDEGTATDDWTEAHKSIEAMIDESLLSCQSDNFKLIHLSNFF